VSDATSIACRLPDGRAVRVSLRPEATIVAVGDEDVSSYDLVGRPYALAREEATWRRALDGRWLEKRPAQGSTPRLRRRLSAEDGVAVAEAARGEVEAVLAALPGPSSGAAVLRLRRIAAMDPRALQADAARFAALYGPVGILPPDQYLALVVQLTEGCSWGSCTFCDLYRRTRFRVKSAAELRAHVAAIRGYFRESIALRRSLFVGDANALCVAHERLLPLLEIVVAEFPELAERGLTAFVDAFSGRRTSARELGAYARLGLKRVYVGLETGDASLLRWLDKPGTPEDAVELVDALHESGLAVGVIVLVGAGGMRFAAEHARRTSEVLTRLRLNGADILYFSEIVEHPGREYARRMASGGIAALDAAELTEQRRAIAGGFRPATPARPPHQATYDIREFAY
jgi:hypothetical protein